MGDVRGISQHDDRPPEWAVLLTEALSWLFASGHAADIVLAVILGELAWLTARRGWPFAEALLRLGPGALMLVSLRGALTHADWPWIALPLIMSFPVHLADLARRTNRKG